MSGISTSIRIYDFATQPLNAMNNAIQQNVSSLQQLDDVLSQPFNTSGLSGVVDDINQIREELSKNFATGNIDEPIIIPTEVEKPALPEIPTPEPIPVTWDVQDVEVFTGNGMERFEQEVSAANRQLNTLNETQRQIGRTAAGIDIIPDNAYLDIKNMALRLEDVRNEISKIEANPMDLNINSVNKDLETLRQSLSKAESQQMELNAAMERMDGVAITRTYNNLNNTISKTEREIRDNINAQQDFTNEVVRTDKASSALRGTVMKVAGVLAAAISAREIIGLSDSITQTTARLDLMNDGLQTTAKLNDMIFQSALRSRGSYLETADAVASLGGNARDAFENTAEIIHFSELLNKQFTIAGTSVEGMSAATLQLTQAMGMGALRGEELNSILEQAPNIVQSIADYMEVPIGAIKDMASEGQITADIVKYAMFNAADDINAKFESMPMTFAQVGQQISNYALHSFQPVLQQLNNLANSQAFQNFVQSAINAIAIVAHFTILAFEGMAKIGSFVADNWSLIAPAVYGAATALAVYGAYLLVTSTISAINTAIGTAQAIVLALKTGETIKATAATYNLTVAQWALNSAFLASPITWVVIGIIAIITAIYGAIAIINKFAGTSISATGVVAGVFMSLATALYNIFAYLWNVFASVAEFFVNVWKHPVYSTQQLFANLANNILDIAASITGSFDNVATNIANAFVKGANMAIGAVNWIIDALNKIPGINIGKLGQMKGTSSITSSIRGLQSNINDWAGDTPDGYWSAPKMDMKPLSQGWNAGYEWGSNLADSVSNFSLTDSIMDFLGMDPAGAGIGDAAGIGDFDFSDIPGIDELDVPGASGGGTPKAVKGIADDVGKISDSLETTKEDLKYMIDLASRQVINRHTVHNDFKFDMSGANYNVENEADLDGIVDKMASGLKEAWEIATEGV